MDKKRVTRIICLATILLTACSPSPQVIQAAIAETQAAWTQIPSYTPQPTIVVTRVVVQTPVLNNQNSCKPIINMDYSDNKKFDVLLLD